MGQKLMQVNPESLLRYPFSVKNLRQFDARDQRIIIPLTKYLLTGSPAAHHILPPDLRPLL